VAHELAGIGVFAAAADDVQTIMDDDPGVRAGIFTYDMHPAHRTQRTHHVMITMRAR
jgi:hypothetical protein